jgi:hypothetical protein
MYDYGVDRGTSSLSGFNVRLDMYYYMDHRYDTGSTMVMINYSLAAKRTYEFSILVSQQPSGTDQYKHYVSSVKTVQHSGSWVKYESEASPYASVSSFGELAADDISAELITNNSIGGEYRSYLIIKNNLRNASGFYNLPNYYLNCKYNIDVVSYTTTVSGPPG